MKLIRFLSTLVFTILLVYALNRSWGEIPPVGKVLDPFGGLWQNAENSQQYKEGEFYLMGLQSQVSVKFDERRVPHIFAANDHDLYFMQGYITARDRLWQMDLQTRAAAGRISEVVGEKTLDYDRYMRRIGMVYGATNRLKEMESDPFSKMITDAYTEGVNCFISELSYREYPVEYKL